MYDFSPPANMFCLPSSSGASSLKSLNDANPRPAGGIRVGALSPISTFPLLRKIPLLWLRWWWWRRVCRPPARRRPSVVLIVLIAISPSAAKLHTPGHVGRRSRVLCLWPRKEQFSRSLLVSAPFLVARQHARADVLSC